MLTLNNRFPNPHPNNAYESYIREQMRIIKSQVDKLAQTDAEKINLLIRDDALFRIWADFEFIYRLIFGSQIALLLIMTGWASDFGTITRIRENFDVQMKIRNIRNLSFDAWLEFLIKTNLLQERPQIAHSAKAVFMQASESKKYEITARGIAFISWISERRYDLKKNGA